MVKQAAKLQPKHAPVSRLRANEQGVWLVTPHVAAGRLEQRLSSDAHESIAVGVDAKVLATKLAKLVPGSNKNDAVNVSIYPEELALSFDGFTAGIKTSQYETHHLDRTIHMGSTVLQATSKALIDAWTRVKPALGTDDTLPMLTHAALLFDNGKVELVATDRFRLHVATVDGMGIAPAQGNYGTTGVPVPRQALDAVEAVYKGLDTDVVVSFDPGNGSGAVGTDTMVFSFTADFDYPRVKGLIPPTPAPYTVGFDRKQLATALKKFKGFTKNRVHFKRTTNGVMLSASDNDDARLEKVLEASSTLDKPVGYNPEYLLDAVELFDGKDLTMHITDVSRPMVMRDEQLLTLLMPVRLPA
ncbi:DNA polymerase III subunit beta [Corynebacterium propinquum]